MKERCMRMETKTSASARNIGCMITMMTLCSLLITGFGNIKQDMWISAIIAAMIALPLYLVYSRIASINPGLGLFEIAYRHFGKIGGGILTCLLSLYALHVTTLVTHNFTDFVSVISLENTPKPIVIIGMIVVSGLLASKTLKVIGQWSMIILIAIAINFVVTFLWALPEMHFTYLLPVMEHSFSEILLAALSIGAIAFGETALALTAFGSLEPGEKPYKAYLIGIGCGIVLLLIAIMRNTLVLGGDMAATSIFPSYVTARIIHTGNYIEHIESVVSFNMILLGVTKISICIRAASTGVARLLGHEEKMKRYIVLICLVSYIVCIATSSNIMVLIEFVKPYRYYALFFTVLIPIIIWIKSELDKGAKGARRQHP